MKRHCVNKIPDNIRPSAKPTTGFFAVRGILICGVVAGLLLVRGNVSSAADQNTSNPAVGGTNSVASAPQKRKTARTLSGAELYSMHCNRCHPERYPTERTAAQWKTILTHMRVRANIPARDARTILGYLQENSGR
jgi:hypothetical protein